MAIPELISIVDDDESVRQGLSRLLTSVGFTVNTFASAEEYLSSHQLERADCLILDIRMSGRNGIELQLAFGNNPVSGHIVRENDHYDISCIAGDRIGRLWPCRWDGNGNRWSIFTTIQGYIGHVDEQGNWYLIEGCSLQIDLSTLHDWYLKHTKKFKLPESQDDGAIALNSATRNLPQYVTDQVFFSGAHLGEPIEAAWAYYFPDGVIPEAVGAPALGSIPVGGGNTTAPPKAIADAGAVSHSGAPTGEKELDFRTNSNPQDPRRVLVDYRESDGVIVYVCYWHVAGDKNAFSAGEIRYLTDLNRGRGL